MKNHIITFAVTFYLIFSGDIAVSQGFLKADGKQIVQEPYMFQLSEVAGTQTEIKSKISELIGQKNCDEFYTLFMNNMISEKDIDALKKWGFNSIRLPMHYNLFTLPVDKEPVKDQNSWVETGFKLTDNLLSWC